MRLWWLSLHAVLLLCGCRSDQHLACESLVLVDASGTVKARLASDGVATSMVLYDDMGNPALRLQSGYNSGGVGAVEGHAPLVQLLDRDGMPRIDLRVGPDGSSVVGVFGASGVPLCTLVSDSGGGAMLRIGDEEVPGVAELTMHRLLELSGR